MASTDTNTAGVGEQSPIYDNYLSDSELDGEQVSYQMETRFNTFDDIGGESFFYTLGQLTVSNRRVIFVSPRQVIDTKLSEVETVRHKKDRINRWMLVGILGLLFGLIIGFVTASMGIIAMLLSLVLLAIGVFIRGEELVISTGGDKHRFRTIRTREGLDAAAAIREQQYSN